MNETIEHDVNNATCACPNCGGYNPDATDASLDPLAGGSLNGKPIWTAEQIAAHLNRTGAAWADGVNDANNARQNNIGDDNSVITFGFFNTQQEVRENGYVFVSATTGRLTGYSEFFNFAPMSAAQRDAAREAMQSWDDVVAVSFREDSAGNADINFGNLANAPNTQAYAYLPDGFWENFNGGQSREIGGDIWISNAQANNLFQLDEGGYGLQTLAHEIGHAIGISHPGGYNAAPGLSITYAANAEYAQDTRAYTIMSYFNGSSIAGTRHNDFHTHTLAYAGSPLIHDIAAAQRMYGADMTTRTGDTVYGFNSTAGRDAFDFTKTPAPIAAIWDAGGIDTLDTSGFATTQLIDLRAGSLSSIGGVTADTAPSFEQVNANRLASGFPAMTQAAYDANIANIRANPDFGRLTDNFGIAYGVTIENAIGGSGADTIIGNEVANVLTGNAGNDSLSGGLGDDTLDGGVGNDTLDGGVGKDRLAGGAGDDLYIVDSADDVVLESAGEGNDTVRSTVSHALANNVENLILVGKEDKSQSFGAFAAAAAAAAATLTGTGNALANTIEAIGSGDFVLSGGGGNDKLVGSSGNDVLDGGDGDDLLIGGAGNDSFTGGLGADVFEGGEGDDFYLIDDSVRSHRRKAGRRHRYGSGEGWRLQAGRRRRGGCARRRGRRRERQQRGQPPGRQRPGQRHRWRRWQ
jgi:serralysin